MARTVLTPITITPQTAAVTPGSQAVTPVAADADDGNAFVATGREVLLALNGGAETATITIPAASDSIGRVGAITAYAIPAGAIARFGPFRPSDWVQVDGYVHVTASANTVAFVLMRL